MGCRQLIQAAAAHQYPQPGLEGKGGLITLPQQVYPGESVHHRFLCRARILQQDAGILLRGSAVAMDQQVQGAVIALAEARH